MKHTVEIITCDPLNTQSVVGAERDLATFLDAGYALVSTVGTATSAENYVPDHHLHRVTFTLIRQLEDGGSDLPRTRDGDGEEAA